MAAPIDSATTPLVFSGYIPSTPEAVCALLTDLRRALTARDHPEARQATWELVLAELLNNVVEHAYRGDHTRMIGYWLLFSHEGVAGQIWDAGLPMPGLTLPRGAAAVVDGPLADLPEGGFGWNLIRRLTERIEYRRIDGVNQLEFTVASPVRE